jgi:putative sterol carrier protein
LTNRHTLSEVHIPNTLNKLLDGKLNATVAYMTKKLKIRGDIALAMKLESLLR